MSEEYGKQIEPTFTFFEKLVATGAVPPNVIRFVVDSGPPDGVPKIYWETFGTKGLCDVLVDEMKIRIGEHFDADNEDLKEKRKSYRQILIEKRDALDARIKETEDWDK